MPSPTVKEIVEEYLRQHGYDGLYHSVGECACEVGDLWPCYPDMSFDCCAGVRAPCDCGECDFHIVEREVE